MFDLAVDGDFVRGGVDVWNRTVIAIVAFRGDETGSALAHYETSKLLIKRV